MSLSGMSLLTKRSEMDAGVAEHSVREFLAERCMSVNNFPAVNNFPSWLRSKMMYIKQRALCAQASWFLMLDTSLMFS